MGFRPFVFRAAREAGLAGLVRNDSEGVWIEVEGSEASLARFADALAHGAPPLARVTSIEAAEMPAAGDVEFRVVASEARAKSDAAIPADTATCDACVRELFDPKDRRFRYPFVNCTDCGPRYTIVRDLPYDRAKTTMDRFAMCAACLAEYEDPANRRFHAEPNACPACGPRAALFAPGGARASADAAVRRAVTLLADGAIVAVKGLGGYQLACDATKEDAVARLRARKRRPHKPFALMARDLAHVARVVRLDDAARAALTSPARPIVLLPRAESAHVAFAVAPALNELGVMLPTTPLHHLLLEGPPLLVMTSGNLSDEPIVKDDEEARERLAAIADAFLLHDRAIHTRADDSVVRVVAGAAQPVRRARGLAPEPVALGFDAPCVLAVGAEQKSAVCVTRGGHAYLSQHLGDLADPDARAFFVEVIEKFQRLLGAAPACVAHDLHPEYASTRWALEQPLARVAVQHHHAHVASCIAEHGAPRRVIGVAWDGTGCGPDGELWGSEFFDADLAGFKRMGHVRPLVLAGGEAAIRGPWRLAAAALLDARAPLEILARVPREQLDGVRAIIARGLACPPSCGAGRWFDAVAAMLGVRDTISYDAQAAIELEALAAGARGDAPPYPFDVGAHDWRPFTIDLRPAVRAIANDVRRAAPRADIAARFHATMAQVVARGCAVARAHGGADTVALSGGCFQNRLLTELAKSELEKCGFDVLVHRRVPPNDGGVALGQAAVAAFRMLHAKETPACA